MTTPNDPLFAAYGPAYATAYYAALAAYYAYTTADNPDLPPVGRRTRHRYGLAMAATAASRAAACLPLPPAEAEALGAAAYDRACATLS